MLGVNLEMVVLAACAARTATVDQLLLLDGFAALVIVAPWSGLAAGPDSRHAFCDGAIAKAPLILLSDATQDGD